MDIEPADNDDDATAAASSSSNTVPDDVQLPCGDHFHWECLLDSYEYSKCPHCSQPLTSHDANTGQDKIVVDLHNEGGKQEGIDIAPILREESYLRAYPEERKCRAFLEFCREGDHRAVAQVLKSCDEADGHEEEDEDDEMEEDGGMSGTTKTRAEILRYQDPINDMQSGLHAAAAGGHREVAWMLLLLGSTLSEMEFPALVFQEAAALGIMRDEDQTGLVDIRRLKDAHSRTAEDVARETGVVWRGWIGNGRLAMP